MAYEIYLGAAAGVILRIVMQNGYAGLPQFYTTVDGKRTFQLNILGAFLMGIIASILTSLVAIQTGATPYADFGSAFAGTYVLSSIVDNSVSKLTADETVEETKDIEGEA